MEIALRPVVQQIRSYRANREHPRAPFPVEIWQNLSKLAVRYGTSEVAKQARVDPATLKSSLYGLACLLLAARVFGKNLWMALRSEGGLPW